MDKRWEINIFGFSYFSVSLSQHIDIFMKLSVSHVRKINNDYISLLARWSWSVGWLHIHTWLFVGVQGTFLFFVFVIYIKKMIIVLNLLCLNHTIVSNGCFCWRYVEASIIWISVPFSYWRIKCFVLKKFTNVLWVSYTYYQFVLNNLYLKIL